MGFGYKTSWIAVHGRTSEEVADALGLSDRRPMAYAEGTSAAYEAGIYVTPMVQGWILAHGTDLASTIDETSDRMLDWLSGLSQSLGTVQFFGTHRVSEWHQWVWAEDGSIIRAFAYADGQARMSVGEVTEAERAAGVVLQDDEPGMSSWSEEQWEASYDSHPDEQHVMQIAGMWSVDPTSIDDDIASAGIYGIPAS